MLAFLRLVAGIALLSILATPSLSQQIITGKIIDAETKEPVAGATVHCSSKTCACGCATNEAGVFELKTTRGCCILFSISSIGYISAVLPLDSSTFVVSLQQAAASLETVTITANREGVKRSLAPVAIGIISSKTIHDTKPVSIDQVLNKVSGVNMVNLGSEQHQMSIRQPMTTKSLFLYLEDGIPVRTTGLFNHNALLEINMTAIKSIEVIKGPSSSLYGSEAIGGVVNFITQSAGSEPMIKLTLQGNTIGYKRADIQSSIRSGKWGFVVGGYYADKRNSFIEYTDYHKGTLTAKADFQASPNTMWSNTVTWLDYYSDMNSGVDSQMFVRRSFTSLQTFTYRKVKAFRYRSSIVHNWNGSSRTSLSLIYRRNSIIQNPAYSIKNDFRRLQNGNWAGNKELAHGEINNSSFNSYALVAQHRQKFNWKEAILIAGASADLSPATYSADYIRIRKDSITGKYLGYQNLDSMLTNYKTGLTNYAAYVNAEFNPLKNLHVVMSVRYDIFSYNFDNHLRASSYSGSPDTLNHFKRISPKLGFTYNFSARTGIYANYSEGFVPPQVTEMYKGVKVPVLDASVFRNYEIGGWWEIIKNKLSVDLSLYELAGINEIISVKLEDGSTENRNAGRTIHRGMEAGLKAEPVKGLEFRFSGALNTHKFVQFVEKGNSYNGNEMNGAPRWIHNTELWYRPYFLKGLRAGIEWQNIGSYFMDPQNTVKYQGYNAINIRTGYRLNGFELWASLMNATNSYYSYISAKSNSGYSFTPAEPRHLNMGVSYDFGEKITHKKIK